MESEINSLVLTILPLVLDPEPYRKTFGRLIYLAVTRTKFGTIYANARTSK